MPLTKTNYEITILADDYAVAADKLIEMLDARKDKKPLPFKTVFARQEGKPFRVYIDEVNEDNDYGKIGSIEPSVDADDLARMIADYTVNVEIDSYSDITDEFSGKLAVIKDENIVSEKMSSIPAKLEKMIDQKIKDGVNPEFRDALVARVQYLLDNYVNILDIQDVIAYWDVDCLNQWGSRIPTFYVDPNLELAHKQSKSGIISRAVQTYLVGNPKILKGPKSTGKNTCINSIVWVFGDSVEEHTFTMQDSMADVISSEGTDNTAMEKLRVISTKLLADAEKVRLAHSTNPDLEYSTKDDETLLAEALFKQLSAEAGSVHIIHEYRGFARWLLDGTGHKCYVADELNMADANLLVGLLHPILDGSITEYDIPGRGPVKLAKHLMMFATMNVGYAGEQEGNPATRSRFGAFELGQPASISGILHSAVASELRKKGVSGDLPEKYYTQAEAFYNGCKAATEKDGEVSDQCLNIRGIVRAMVETKRFEGRTTLNQKLEDEVVTPCDDDERTMLMMLLNRLVKC